MSRAKVAADAEKGKSKEFLDKAAKDKGAVKTPSGLVYKELKAQVLGTAPAEEPVAS